MHARIFAFSCALAMLIATSAIFAPVAFAATTCHPGSTPAPGSRVTGGLVVDGFCFLQNVTVTGGVTVLGTGNLRMFGGSVSGGIRVAPGGELDFGFNPAINRGTTGGTVNGGIVLDGAKDVDLWNSTINGGLTMTGTFAAGYFPTICGNSFNGNVSIDAARTVPNAYFIFGDARHNTIFGEPCPGNTIRGSLSMTDSQTFEVEDNSITGSVLLSGSRLELNGNTIGGSLHCSGATVILPPSPGDATGNTVRGSNSC